jgi:hypothetical protein
MSTYAAFNNGDGERQVAAPRSHRWRKGLSFRGKASGKVKVKSHQEYLRQAKERAKAYE